VVPIISKQDAATIITVYPTAYWISSPTLAVFSSVLSNWYVLLGRVAICITQCDYDGDAEIMLFYHVAGTAKVAHLPRMGCRIAHVRVGLRTSKLAADLDILVLVIGLWGS
jgi:hypothetical protein